MKILTCENARKICQKNEFVFLNLGCGLKKAKNFINIDISSKVNPDYVYDLSKPLPFPENSIHIIVSIDLFEHFDKYVRYIVMESWAKALVQGGGIFLRVPDFEYFMKNRQLIETENLIEILYGETMAASKIFISHFGNHKWAYTPQSLKNFGKLFGIEFSILDNKGYNTINHFGKELIFQGEPGSINVSGTKKFNQRNDITINSYGNALGDGKPFITLKEAKNIIGQKNYP